MNQLFHADNLACLKTFKDNSISSIVTDCPYGLKFMGKKWDYNVPSVALWQEVFRVLKPGGHVLSFGGTRTYHRMVVNIEDAGFEIRDQIQWLYGSGFPKSYNVGKGVEGLKTIGTCKTDKFKNLDGVLTKASSGFQKMDFETGHKKKIYKKTKIDVNFKTDEGKQWEGWGTALKPANEPIVLARKPISEKTIAANVLKWGTGALNIDECRIGTETRVNQAAGNKAGGNALNMSAKGMPANVKSREAKGRWAANVILDEHAGKLLGEPSRFFYCAKPSKKERNAGCEGLKDRLGGSLEGGDDKRSGKPQLKPTKNNHPTVKPIMLMEYLCKLITPPKGNILDPYMGSGSTGIACNNLGFDFVGIERDKEYFEIAKARINNKGSV